VTLTVGSLFSGIGGLDFGLERAGMRVIWQSEIDPYACRVLANHWPNTPNLGDITRIDWSTVERPDVICGGYPCQPFSYAGSRNGEHDPRHLWPYFLDAIRALRPRYAVMENVPGHLSMGFGRVLGDLAESGYDAEWDCIPAAAVGAPHRRDRVFIVAGNLADADEIGRDGWTRESQDDTGWPQPTHRSQWTIEPDVGRALDGFSAWLDGSNRISAPVLNWESGIGRIAAAVPHRVDRVRALGNAVVPQVAEHIGRMITRTLVAS
jgi:DNA (cytosine-5)-methyltransferase 1